MIERFAIYGLQRSGTNYVQWLMRQNFPQLEYIEESERGTKHSPAAPFDSKAAMLLCVKHPLAWVRSLFEWKPRDGAIEDWSGAPRSAYWNGCYRAWLALERPRQVIRAADLAVNPKAVVRKIAQRWELDEPAEIVTSERRIDSTGGESDQQFTRRDYYGKGEYLAAYPLWMLSEALGIVDWSLAARLGYPLDLPYLGDVVERQAFRHWAAATEIPAGARFYVGCLRDADMRAKFDAAAEKAREVLIFRNFNQSLGIGVVLR